MSNILVRNQIIFLRNQMFKFDSDACIHNDPRSTTIRLHHTMELLSLTDYVVVAKLNSNCLFFWYLKLINI